MDTDAVYPLNVYKVRQASSPRKQTTEYCDTSCGVVSASYYLF